jgi:hypothetical protein
VQGLAGADDHERALALAEALERRGRHVDVVDAVVPRGVSLSDRVVDRTEALELSIVDVRPQHHDEVEVAGLRAEVAEDQRPVEIDADDRLLEGLRDPVDELADEPPDLRGAVRQRVSELASGARPHAGAVRERSRR